MADEPIQCAVHVSSVDNGTLVHVDHMITLRHNYPINYSDVMEDLRDVVDRRRRGEVGVLTVYPHGRAEFDAHADDGHSHVLA